MGLLNENAEAYYSGSDYGSYQFITIKDIVNNFMVAYVGEGKLIPKAKRTDVGFHAQRAIQEFSFDTLPGTKSYEAELGPALSFVLPQDYVNYTEVSYIDKDGGKRKIYPTRHTNNPTSLKGTADNPTRAGGNLDLNSESTSLTRFKTAPNNIENDDINLSDSDIFDLYRYGNRYGLSPEHSQFNGVFYIDQTSGIIRFSSNLADQIIVLDYISDGLATDEEMKVHKFAEEAMYKYMVHAILNTRANVPEYQIARYKKELRAAKRNAKLRLSNLKIAELAQVMRNQSKWIKH